MRFKPDGPLFLRAYLDKHPSVETRLRAQGQRALRGRRAPESAKVIQPFTNVIQLRAELSLAMRTIRYLHDRVETRAPVTQATRIRQVDPAEQERRDDVWRHPQAYTARAARDAEDLRWILRFRQSR